MEDKKDIENGVVIGNVRQLLWDMAIGLQKVDDLSLSAYLNKLTEENVNGTKSVYDVLNELRAYYTEQGKKNEINYNEFECDMVSTKIVEILEEDGFSLSIDYLKYLHEYLFRDIYDFSGEFRNVDISKNERILNDDTVEYGQHDLIKQSLEYSFLQEKNKDFEEMDTVDIVHGFARFTSNLWQIHPFREGNTRTTAVFIEKYLISLGVDIDNSYFKEKSVYFRNALVRSCYHNKYLNIKKDDSYLIKFYENLLLGKNHSLHSKDLIVKELFDLDETRSR